MWHTGGELDTLHTTSCWLVVADCHLPRIIQSLLGFADFIVLVAGERTCLFPAAATLSLRRVGDAAGGLVGT